MSQILQRLRQKPAPNFPPSPCPVCQNLIFTTSDLKISVPQLRTESLKPSPCPCCSLLWHLISKITSSDTVHADITYDHLLFTLPSYLDRQGTGPLYGHLLPNPLLSSSSSTPIPSQDLQFYTHPSSPPSPFPSIGIAPPIPTHALAPSSLPLLRTWLTSCTTSTGRHSPCPRPPFTHPLPTRLIDVRPSPPRLHLPPQSPPPTTPSPAYAALSHCWANRPTLRTLTATLPSHLVALPSPLPQTFADAVAVTKALAIPFLWIDSLCIIQDSPADWAREASRMGDVYAHALVTISADAAAGPDAGFLSPGARSVGREVGGHVAGGGTVYVRKRGVLAEELPFHSLEGEGGGRSLLSTRGWVFQERLLAPRTVHFSRGETAWECRALCDCECSVVSPRTVRTGSVVKRFLIGGEGGAGMGETWRREVVPAYTRLDLTVVTDRLPALEGLARAMRGGGGYLWGLWRETLGRDLLWRTEGGGKKGEVLPEGYAPTWSWGSVVGQVMYDEEEEGGGDEEEGGVEIVDVDDVDGVLKARAWAVDVRVKWARRDVVVPADADNSPPFERRRPQRGGQMPLVELGVVWDHRKGGGADASAVYTFLVFGSRSGKRGPFGLLLRAVGERGEATRFRRVGFIGGYQRSVGPRLRRWGSGGWETDPTDDVHTFVTGYRDRDSAGGSDGDLDRWDGWTERVLGLPRAEVEII